MKLRAPLWGFACICTFLVGLQAHANAGVLDRIAAGGRLVLAYRESSVPFSYLDANKKPVGYALDLCYKIADVIRKKTGRPDMPIDLVMVTPANRMQMVAEGKADMECGSTTNNAERRQKVAFTIPHFITGARLLVRSNSPIDRIEDLEGKKLVSTKGTTPLQAVRQANSERLMHIAITEVPDHAKALRMVETGEADAFAMDDVLLFGLAANSAHPSGLKVVGKFITTEALAIMLPKGDAALKQLVDDKMRQLIQSHEIDPIYDKWFAQPIPPRNTALNLPVSYLLRDFWKYPNDYVPF